MKAAYIEQVGPPESIRYGDLPSPEPGPRDVLVRVAAVCVDPIDTYIRSGRFRIELQFPYIIGRDMTGTVEKTGADVTGFAPGDRVWCNNQGYDGRHGTFCEQVAIHERLLYPLPAAVDERQAIAFVHSGLTACIGLKLAAPQRGETLFVNGGSGNVGSAIIQLAKARGARVFATAGSADGVAWCRSIGADEAVNYREEDVATRLAAIATNGINIHWDASGHPDFDWAVARLAPGGRLIVMSGLTQRPPFPVGPFYVKGCSMHGFAVTHATEAVLASSAVEINRWMASGNLRVRIDETLPLSEAAKAHQLVEGGARLSGKIVLTP